MEQPPAGTAGLQGHSQHRLGQLEVAGPAPNGLAFIEHQPYRAGLELVIKLPSGFPGVVVRVIVDIVSTFRKVSTKRVHAQDGRRRSGVHWARRVARDVCLP